LTGQTQVVPSKKPAENSGPPVDDRFTGAEPSPKIKKDPKLKPKQHKPAGDPNGALGQVSSGDLDQKPKSKTGNLTQSPEVNADGRIGASEPDDRLRAQGLPKKISKSKTGVPDSETPEDFFEGGKKMKRGESQNAAGAQGLGLGENWSGKDSQLIGVGADDEEPASGDGGVADLMEKKYGKPRGSWGSHVGLDGGGIENNKKLESGKLGAKTPESDAGTEYYGESDASAEYDGESDAESDAADKRKPKTKWLSPDVGARSGDGQAAPAQPKKSTKGPAIGTSDPRDPISQQDSTLQGPTENSQSPKKAAPPGDSDDSDSGHPTKTNPGPPKKKPTKIANQPLPPETPPMKPKATNEPTSIPSLKTQSNERFDLNSQSEPSGISPSPQAPNPDTQEEVSDFYSPGQYMDIANPPGKHLNSNANQLTLSLMDKKKNPSANQLDT
jgi:hypothetical protein